MFLKLKCPQCKQNLKQVYAYTSATMPYDRKCPKCKTKWRLIVRPIKKTDKMMMHELDWTVK